MTGDPTLVRYIAGLYAAVVALYPRDLEPEYREAIRLHALELLRKTSSQTGATGVLRLCPGLFADILREVVTAHARNWSGPGRRPLLEPLVLDLRHAARAVLGAPASTTLIALLLALAVAAQALVLAAVDGILLRPLPYAAADRLVVLHEVSDREPGDRQGVSPGTLLDWRTESRSFDGVAASATWTMTAATPDGSIAVRGTRVTADFFRVFERAMAAGRPLAADDFPGAVWQPNVGFAGAQAVAVISQRLAIQQFGGVEAAVERTLMVDGIRWRVVGVVDPAFEQAAGAADLWLPWNLDASYRSGGLPQAPRTFRFLRGVARLAPGVTLDAAQRELSTIAAGLAARYPVEHAGWGVAVTATAADLSAAFAPTLIAVSLAIQLVLALAGANVASLLVSRNLVRSGNFAIRRLLGASRIRVLRQVSFECVLLVGLGGTAGLLVAYLACPFVMSLLPPGTPRASGVRIDARVIVSVAMLCGIYTLGLAAMSYRQFVPGDRSHRLRESSTAVGGVPRTGIRSSIVTVQVALAVTVVITGGLIAQSLIALEHAPLGFSGDSVTVTRVAVDPRRYAGATTAAFFEQLTSALRANAGVTAVAAVTALPLSDVGADFNRPYWPEGELPPAGQFAEARITTVTPGYFTTLAVPLLAGRDLHASDRRDTPRVVVINQALNDRAWPGRSAVGENLIIDYREGRYPYRIVGVVANTLHDGARRRVEPEIYIPHAQNAYPLMNVVIRSPLRPGAVADMATRAVAQLDPNVAVQSVTTMTELQDRAVANERLAAQLLLALAILSLLIVAVGLYGVVALAVSNRQREIALRMALGASGPAVYGLFLRWAVVFVATGCAAGAVGGMVAGRQVSPLLFQIQPDDPWTFAAAVGGVLVVSIAAILLPLRRASAASPAVLLRSR